MPSANVDDCASCMPQQMATSPQPSPCTYRCREKPTLTVRIFYNIKMNNKK